MDETLEQTIKDVQQELLIVSRHPALVLQAQHKVRTLIEALPNHIIGTTRRRIHEASDHDVALFTSQSNWELAHTLRNAMPWIATGLHALMHAVAERLAHQIAMPAHDPDSAEHT